MTTETTEEILIDEKISLKKDLPSKYNVIFLNDNQTPMDFVTELLISLFKHSKETAEKIMLTVHEEGKAVVGTYTFEIAEQKTTEAIVIARKEGFPLGIQMEVV